MQIEYGQLKITGKNIKEIQSLLEAWKASGIETKCPLLVRSIGPMEERCVAMVPGKFMRLTKEEAASGKSPGWMAEDRIQALKKRAAMTLKA